MVGEQQPQFVKDLDELVQLQGQTVEVLFHGWEYGFPAVVGEPNDRRAISLYRRLENYTTEDGVSRRDSDEVVNVQCGVSSQGALGNRYNHLRVRVLTEEEQDKYKNLPISYNYQPRRAQ